MHRLSRTFVALALASLALGGATAARAQPTRGAVYTTSNDPAGNEVIVFGRTSRGLLVPHGRVATGGAGTGGGLGNQGALILTRNEKWLLAVNAASNSISVFAVRSGGPVLVDVVSSEGIQPVSLTEHRGLVYVLNAGSDEITGFELSGRGHLQPLAGSTRSLSGVGTAPAQVSFSADGDALVVTEKATNQIVTYLVDRAGLPGAANVQPSNGQTPFGFAFGKRGQLFVSEAFGGAPGASATSSYTLQEDGTLVTVSATVPTNQTANCWVVVTPDGRYTYVTNTGSGSISGYAIGFDGQITLLDADGRTGITGGGPIDLALTDNGRFLYSLNGGTNTIGAFQVRGDGRLEVLPFATGLPVGANGLAAH